MSGDDRKSAVLVVEDDAAVAKVLKNYLGRCGFDVRTAADAELARAAMAEAAPDVLLVDMVLPGVSGLDFIKELRATEAGAGMPVVLMSGVFSVGADEPVARELDIAGFLPKPITLPQLLATLKRAVAGGSSAADGGAEKGQQLQIPDELSPRAVAGVLLRLLDARRSGVLSLKHGDDEITISVLRGVPVNSRSSLRQHTLGSYLLSIGRLDEAQILKVDREMRVSNVRFGEAATRLGLVRAAEVVDLLRGAVLARVAQAATWSEGKISFLEEAAQAEKSALTEIDPVEAILLGYLRHGDIAEAVRSFGAQRHLHVCPATRFSAYAAFLEQHAPATPLVTAIADAPKLHDLLVTLQQAGETGVRQLYAMWAAQMISFEEQPIRAAPPAERGAGEVLQHGASAGWSASAPEIELIFAEYLRCQGLDHYGVLGVPHDAGSTAIEQAGQAMLERLSSPAFTMVSEPSACARLEEVRAWTSHALRVLCDPAQRIAYDQSLSGYQVAAPAGLVDPEAEDLYRRGREALGQQDFDGAVHALRQAVERCPEDPDFGATLGWAETRRAQAEAQRGFERLVDVCARNPQSARAHLYLGLVVEGRGEIEQARHALRRAVELNPSLSEAQQALARVSGSERDLYGELFGDLPFIKSSGGET